MFAILRNYLQREDGATVLEYALIVAAIALVIGFVVFDLGNENREVMENLAQEIDEGIAG